VQAFGCVEVEEDMLSLKASGIGTTINIRRSTSKHITTIAALRAA
jgi:hypothetical protein